MTARFTFNHLVTLPDSEHQTYVLWSNQHYIDPKGYVRFDDLDLRGLCVPLTNITHWQKYPQNKDEL